MDKELIKFVNETFSLDLQNSSYVEVKAILSEKINGWIINDFNKLIHVLYRIDVSETKINQLLKDNQSEDAANILADLIIERQLEKIKTKQEFREAENNSEEEKW